MNKIFTWLVLMTLGITAAAQQYNNEWINYNQTYYKFKVGSAGVYRLPKTLLDNAGIGNTPVEFFELYRNGKHVPFYSSVPSGVLPVNGYIEFYGVPNDGETDRKMYRDTSDQHTTKTSLLTDTSVYFLSINTNQSGLKFATVINDAAGSMLPVEPYFIHTAGNYYRERINLGKAAVVGEYVFSSAYDKGEYWSSGDIRPATPKTTAVTGLQKYAAGPASVIRFGASGNALNPRSVRVNINGTMIRDTIMDYFNDVQPTYSFPTALIDAVSTPVQFVNVSPVGSDRMVISHFEIDYPRLFHFGNQKHFEFKLPAKGAGYLLHITNFNHGAVAPVLYDLTNHHRLTGDISTPGTVKFALPGTAQPTKYVLVNQEPSNMNTVGSLIQKQFTRYFDVAQQGNFLIITHPFLYTGTTGNNPIQEYADYRTSAAGGSNNVKVIDVNELADQFAFGIKKHPLSIKNFIRYARNNFSIPLNYIFLIGRGMTYNEFRLHENDPITENLNLVPTFGTPASDNMLSSADAQSAIPVIPIGRLSAVNGKEIEDYLEKMKEYEYVQKNAPNTIEGRNWMKNVVHVTGSSDPNLGVALCNYMDTYRQIVEDTVFGANVSTFCKTSTNPIEVLTNERIGELFYEGISILTYFGHSSSTTLEFNIDNPQSYNNQGKYPVFFVNGCNAGNFFTYYPQRLILNETLSEKFVFAKQRGSIAFVASTHFGIVNYLNLYLNQLYTAMSGEAYGQSLGEINRNALEHMVTTAGNGDFYARLHAEEITIHGDPSLKLNGQDKPDYTIEEPLININPTFISVAEDNFQLKVKMVNLGKAVDDSVRVEIIRTYPDNTTSVIYDQWRAGIHDADSLLLDVPIVGSRDKGVNKISVTIYAGANVIEVTGANNSSTKEIFIFEDEARPVYPYNYAIVIDQEQKLYASTANPFSPVREYIMEIDTTELFNSTFKKTKQISAAGGLLEFTPGFTFENERVYYWRVALVPQNATNYRWNTTSFVYLNSPDGGFNQSHYFQHTRSTTSRMKLDSTGTWVYKPQLNNIFARNAVYPTAADQQASYMVTVNGINSIYPGCYYNEIIFNVFDKVTFKPWLNDYSGPTGLYNSIRGSNCGGGRELNFQYFYTNATERKKAMDFIDLIPAGSYVLIRFNVAPDDVTNVYVPDWKNDTTVYGIGNSLYHKLYNLGMTDVDSFTRARTLTYFYKKDDNTFVPVSRISEGKYDRINLSTDAPTPDTIGFITSPQFGPAKAWKEVVWRGASMESPSNDKFSVDVIGVDALYNETVLYTLDDQTQNFDISAVSPQQYPYMKLRMRVMDSVNLTPYQLDYWRILYEIIPEGAISPNLFLTMKDTLDVGEPLQFGIAFKNISYTAFDSIGVNVYVLDRNNVSQQIIVPKQKPLLKGDTVQLKFTVDTKTLQGNNTLSVDVNPNNMQPEQHHYNNFLFRSFYVRPDLTNPVLDVTFDGVHILNRDIVSAKPHIQIKLKDEAKYMLLNDTALSAVQVRNVRTGTLRVYNFDNDTLRFNPAGSGENNTATIDFFPQFNEQANAEGDDYELIVKGKDRSGNKAGTVEYRVEFRVISKPMISNLLNYPNPFSTSTAFVFTITGSELPSNLKIQILTVTGKIVREITKDELGPLHIGRNITEFKWDGTDQYGQKLGNGVYLYRVVSTLHGKQMDKYRSESDNTDKFFTNGYGKMYLMR